MNAERYTVRAPGKLFVAGEYAITEPNQDSIVVAVDRFLEIDIQSSRSNRLDLPQMGLTDISWKVEKGLVKFSEPDKRLHFIKHIIETINGLGVEVMTSQLLITSELDDRSGLKYGLGSSAALSVALVTALLKYSNVATIVEQPLTIFKLAAIAHLRAQGNGSCADIAAATYGCWLNYRSFDRHWLDEQLAQGVTVPELIEKEWPSLCITPIALPANLYFLIGWTKQAANTSSMVNDVQALKQQNLASYQAFLSDSNKVVKQIIRGFNEESVELVLTGIKQNRQLLKQLGQVSGVNIETEQLTMLIDIADAFGAAKTSGAGGGDCGIAFVNQADQAEQVKLLWKESGIEPLRLCVSTVGVTID
ncbi:phosphomevalonate kinase [Amphibacillus marinus]|uniref:phosphomevalonate kinase n=1 Tax=Amphibacillus marinus TaxID=872970 RepID=A0A1H8K493_9BACI|nr:phosphomevalonate kinase [Amphibacillus marinus]SEN87763.1 phosphomevalonate kinase [Amphibacillus marinus]